MRYTTVNHSFPDDDDEFDVDLNDDPFGHPVISVPRLFPEDDHDNVDEDEYFQDNESENEGIIGEAARQYDLLMKRSQIDPLGRLAEMARRVDFLKKKFNYHDEDDMVTEGEKRPETPPRLKKTKPRKTSEKTKKLREMFINPLKNPKHVNLNLSSSLPSHEFLPVQNQPFNLSVENITQKLRTTVPERKPRLPVINIPKIPKIELNTLYYDMNLNCYVNEFSYSIQKVLKVWEKFEEHVVTCNTKKRAYDQNLLTAYRDHILTTMSNVINKYSANPGIKFAKEILRIFNILTHNPMSDEARSAYKTKIILLNEMIKKRGC